MITYKHERFQIHIRDGYWTLTDSSYPLASGFAVTKAQAKAEALKAIEDYVVSLETLKEVVCKS